MEKLEPDVDHGSVLLGDLLTLVFVRIADIRCGERIEAMETPVGDARIGTDVSSQHAPPCDSRPRPADGAPHVTPSLSRSAARSKIDPSSCFIDTGSILDLKQVRAAGLHAGLCGAASGCLPA